MMLWLRSHGLHTNQDQTARAGDWGQGQTANSGPYSAADLWHKAQIQPASVHVLKHPGSGPAICNLQHVYAFRASCWLAVSMAIPSCAQHWPGGRNIQCTLQASLCLLHRPQVPCSRRGKAAWYAAVIVLACMAAFKELETAAKRQDCSSVVSVDKSAGTTKAAELWCILSLVLVLKHMHITAAWCRTACTWRGPSFWQACQDVNMYATLTAPV